MGLNKNFSKSKHFSSYSDITTEVRISATSVSDILPCKFEKRTEESYQASLNSLQNGSDSKGLNHDSIMNSVKYFHVAKVGYMPPCMMHDVYQGWARTDCAFVIEYIFLNDIITREAFPTRSKLFRETLCPYDKNSWYPILRPNSFKSKLPGSICQNSKFIQYLPVMMYEELSRHSEFVKSKQWKLYTMLKELCEYFNSPELSDFQINLQTQLLHEYLDLRISLKNEDEMGPISPKHTFSVHYEEIIRTVGCLIHMHTNRYGNTDYGVLSQGI